MKRFLVSGFFLSLVAACDDAELKPTGNSTAVNYQEAAYTISELSAGYEVVILLSEAAEAEGMVEVHVSGEYETFFTTEPAAESGRISLPVAKGDARVGFQVLPVNNAKLNGNQFAEFSITRTTGSVSLGESVSYTLTIVDDELTGKPKTSSRVHSAFSQVNNTYEYNEEGLISKLHWQMKTPFGITSGTEVYTYNETGEIQRIARENTGLEKLYTWEDGVIVKLEQRIDGNVTYYNVYEYDELGRVKNIDNFTRNVGGHFVSTMYESYSYHPDGNTYQVTIYSYRESEDTFVVNLTTTYKDYVEGHNPLPDVNPLPNQSGQTKLPTYYSKETSVVKQEYTVSYEFSPEGLLLKRNVSGTAADAGVTTYTYY